jgi:hypothetical protein
MLDSGFMPLVIWESDRNLVFKELHIVYIIHFA